MPRRYVIIPLVVLAIVRPASAVNISIAAQQPLTFLPSPAGSPAYTVPATDTVNAAKFNVTHANKCGSGTAFNITLPTVPFTLTNGTSTVNVTAVTQSPANPISISSGAAVVYIGGTRDVMPTPVNMATYTGTFSVSVQCSSGGNIASATGTANVVGINSISISPPTDLVFPGVYRGAPTQTVAPASGATATVTGEGGHAYNISFPATSVTMTLNGVSSGGNPDLEIVVNAFTSSPSGSGLLSGAAGSTGTQTLTIGATMAGVRSTQTPGNYSTTYTVTVAYP